METWYLASAVAVGLSLGLIALALVRMPATPIARPLYVFVAAGASWGVGGLLADTATSLAWKQVGLAILYTGAIAAPPAWWHVALRWADQERAGLPLRAAAWRNVPYAFAAALWLAMITNPWHGAFLTPVVGGRNVYQPLWYVMAVPSYGLILAALVVALAAVVRVRSPEATRQGVFLMAASLVTLLGNAAYVSGLVSVDPTPVVLSASGALLVLGMAREGLFGVVPAALPEIAADHPDGLVLTGPDGRVRYANPRARSLLAPVELHTGSSFLDTLGDPRLHSESSLGMRSSPASWTTLARRGAVVLLRDASTTRTLQLSAKVVVGRRGLTKGHCIRIADLTEQRETERQVRRAHRLDSVADLARTVSRQFQGAFELVRNNANLLLDASSDEPEAERKLARIVDAATFGMELAVELQLYTGTVSPERIVLQLSSVVEECCRLVESDLPSRVSLVLSLSDRSLPVCVDVIQLHHGVYNVLKNSIEAMTDGRGELRVETGLRRLDPAEMTLVWGNQQPVGDYAFVRIQDEGGGVSPEAEERIFEPFFSTRHKDRGAGLPTVLGIARAHGAPIAFENTYGRGCAVTLYFPLERDEIG